MGDGGDEGHGVSLALPSPSVGNEYGWEWIRDTHAHHRGIIKLYGKVWQTWDTMKPGGEKLPLGEPVLMTSFNGEGQMKDFETVVGERDRRLGTDWRRKKEIRKAIEEFEPDAGADGAWRK